MTIASDIALARLREGNRRFVDGLSSGQFTSERATESAGGQNPWAVVVGCSDSRVPVEAVFDVGVGDLFVVRTAGHVLAAASIASVRFALEKLGARTVVVLGHEDCGAVSAALAGDAPAWLAPIMDHIHIELVDEANAPADADNALLAAAVDHHVLDTVDALEQLIATFDLTEPVAVAGAAYKLASGEVHWLG
jgi:carbonic anhydrase